MNHIFVCVYVPNYSLQIEFGGGHVRFVGLEQFVFGVLFVVDVLVNGQRTFGRLDVVPAGFRSARGSHEKQLRRQPVDGGRWRRRRRLVHRSTVTAVDRLSGSGQHAIDYAALAAGSGKIGCVRGRRRRRRRGRHGRLVVVHLRHRCGGRRRFVIVVAVIGGRVMVSVVGRLCRRSVGGRGHGSRVRRRRRELMVMVMMVAHERPERFLHHLLKRLGGRCRGRRRYRTHVVLMLKLAVLCTATATAAGTVKVRWTGGRSCGRCRVLISVGDGRNVGQRAVGVRAGRGRLQYGGRKRRVSVHGVRPSHCDPLPFVLHPPVLEPHLKSLTGNTR